MRPRFIRVKAQPGMTESWGGMTGTSSFPYLSLLSVLLIGQAVVMMALVVFGLP
jgi:hypothetical protein